MLNSETISGSVKIENIIYEDSWLENFFFYLYDFVPIPLMKSYRIFPSMVHENNWQMDLTFFPLLVICAINALHARIKMNLHL